MEYTYYDKRYGENVKIIFQPNTNFALIPSYGSGKAYSTHKDRDSMKGKIQKLYTAHASFEVIEGKVKSILPTKTQYKYYKSSLWRGTL